MTTKHIPSRSQVAGYNVDNEDENDDDWDTSKGLRIMGLAYASDFEQAPFACIVAPDGECIEYKKLPNLLKRKNSYREDERLAKVSCTSTYLRSKSVHGRQRLRS